MIAVVVFREGANTEQTEVLAGLVERVTFHNEENGFCVLRVGEWLTASGTWHNDRTHDLQFRAKLLKTSAPTTLDGIEKYLSSGIWKRRTRQPCSRLRHHRPQIARLRISGGGAAALNAAAISSIRASPAASAWSSLWGRERPPQSLFATPPAAGDGPSSKTGFRRDPKLSRCRGQPRVALADTLLTILRDLLDVMRTVSTFADPGWRCSALDGSLFHDARKLARRERGRCDQRTFHQNIGDGDEKQRRKGAPANDMREGVRQPRPEGCRQR